MRSDPRTLRVVLASSQRGWHGGEKQALLLAKGLRARGNDVHLFARRGEVFAQRMSEDGFPVVELAGGGRSLRGILQARRAMRRLRPDVVHANDSHAMTCLWLAGMGLRIPARIASRRVMYPIRTPAQFRYFADRIVCVATEVVQACRNASLPEERLALVFSGSDPSRFDVGKPEQVRRQTREKLGLAGDELFLLCVGKLTEVKRHADLLDALPEVLQVYPHLTLGFAGDGELWEALQAQATQLGVSEKVQFLGYRDDVPELLHAADLYVQPSRSEGLCNAVIDAMFARCPAVVSARGGLLDLIPPTFSLQSDCGWLAPPEDPKGLAATILKALTSSDEEKRRRTENAFARAMENFTADHMVEGVLQVYRDVLASR